MTVPSAEALWRDLLEKDDRTSPEEYPDMALITWEEFKYCHDAAYRRGIEACARWHDDRADRFAAEEREATQSEEQLIAQYGERAKGLHAAQRQHFKERARAERYAAEQHRALAPPQEGS